jgi:hypothetical protein
VAHEVLASLDRSGIPVEYDHVDCSDPDASGTVACTATTAFSPAHQITASFQVRRGAAGCPGVLTVAMDGAPLVAPRVDPCR